MGKLVIDIDEKELVEFGEVKIKEEIEKTLRWLNIKGIFEIISSSLNKVSI